jgi:glycerophosphoryl diester phosphodiesterase
MIPRKRASGLRRTAALLGSVLLLVGVYYAVQVARRTAPLMPLQVIAHRGGATLAPENTLAAFRRAVDLGVDWLEFDVQMTQDGEPVVIHDETVDRTTDGTGAVRDLTLARIRTLDAGNGEQVPTLAEVVALAKAAGIRIMPETKSAHLYAGIEETLLAVLNQADYVDQTVVQSFEPASLATLRALDLTVQCCALTGPGELDLTNSIANAEVVCPMGEMVLLNPGMIRQAHAAGRPVFVWFGPLEHPLSFRLVRFFGADGIMADDPEQVRSILP